MATEYVNGGTLADLVAQRGLDFPHPRQAENAPDPRRIEPVLRRQDDRDEQDGGGYCRY